MSIRSCLSWLALLLGPAVLTAQVPAAPATAPAQLGVLRGSVVTSQGQPVPAASVTVRSVRDSTLVTGALTTAEGRFRIAGLAPGRYLVRVSQLGYRARTLPAVAIAAAAPDIALGTIALESAPVELKGIEVQAGASPVVMTADRTTYRTRDMPAAGGGKAVDVLRGIPELEVDVNGKVTMRGNASVAIHLNDRPAPMQGEQLSNFLQQLPGNAVERVEVLPNPSARYDPQGLGGIVNIVLKSNVDLGLSGTVTGSTGTRGQSLSSRIAYQKGPLTFFGGAGLSHSSSGQNSHDLRANLLARPITYLDVTSAYGTRATFGFGDGTLEYKLDRKTTAWLNAAANPYRYVNDSDNGYLWLDSLQSATSRFGRATNTRATYWSASGSLGARRLIVPGRREWSLELRGSGNHNDQLGRWFQQPLTLAGDTVDPSSLTVSDAGGDVTNWVQQADYTLPVGKRAKLELGLQANQRRDQSDNLQELYPPGTVVAPLSSRRTGYAFEEKTASAYATATVPWRKLSLQAGLRAEGARTDFTVQRTGQSFDNDYNSLFPSGSVLWELGAGRRARLMYSRRLDRPYAYLLNPDVPSSDPLNRQAGNPALKPRYTDNLSAELNLTRSEITWRLAPYLRRTTDDWDNLRSVDSAGVSTITYANLRTTTTYGTSLTSSLRQTGRLGGMASVSVYNTRYDGGNISSMYQQRHAYLSANANAQIKVSSSLNGQLMLMYMPPRYLPQGRLSSIVYSSLGLRQKLGTKGWVNLGLTDPFSLYRATIRTSDGTHMQTSRTSVRMRALSLSATYSFGRPPQSARKGTNEEEAQPQQPQQGPIR